ncbi:MAG: tRNA pseudouridine(13) synthase TruD [Kofleriaceae bacterium]
MTLPYLTAELLGIGGVLRERVEDFDVTELPAYEPSGAGEHVFAWIEKRDLTTPFAIGQLARALGVPARDLGYAGMKDRRAVTRQWISLPPPLAPEQVLAVEIEGLRVLRAARHPHKLRTGHLRGNRFALVLRRCAPGAAATASAALTALAAAPGAPNWYGEQRFGRDGDNAAAGLALVRRQRRFDRDARKNRLLLSALQSHLFNRWLVRRLNDGAYREVLEGDVLRKVGGGVFACTDPGVDQPRLLAGEVVPTGPMFGVEMRGPPPGSVAHRREAEVLAEAELTLEELATVRKLAPGARRDAAVALTDPAVRELAPDVIEVSFALPAGAYATAVLRELQKAPDPLDHGEAGDADPERHGPGDDAPAPPGLAAPT